MANSSNYDASNITVLEGLEAVRRRPGMYIGSVSTKGLNHLIYEIMDNSVDEHLAGFCDRIEVILEAENVRLEACDSFEGKDYLLFCPDYPWNRNNQKQLMTEEAVDELFRKYIPVLTDIPIEIDYQSVENGG